MFIGGEEVLTSEVRRILDGIVRSATVDLFHTSGIATAPVERPNSTPLLQLLEGVHVGLINVVGDGFDASLILSVPESVFQMVSVAGVRPFEISDWILEQTNQLFGRIKSRLARFQVVLKPSLPSTPSDESLRRLTHRSSSVLLYEFRTLRGLVFVAICGRVKLEDLDYSNKISNAREGDIILF